MSGLCAVVKIYFAEGYDICSDGSYEYRSHYFESFSDATNYIAKMSKDEHGPQPLIKRIPAVDVGAGFYHLLGDLIHV